MGRLFWKIFFAFWAVLLVVGAGVGTTVWLYKPAQESMDLASGPRATFMVATAATTLKYGGVVALRDLMGEWSRKGSAHVYVVDGAGRELLGRKLSGSAVAHARALAQAGDERQAEHPAAVRKQGEYLFFVPAANQPLPERLLSPPRRKPSPLFPLFVGLLVSLGLSALLAGYLSKPIRNLKWAFDAVAAGKLETRVAPLMKRRDEIADLGRDFDHMAQQLQLLIAAQRRLLHDVSHELRSPLARMQAAIGLARQNPQKLDATLDRIERESVRLDELVGELLTLSRLEAGTVNEPRERVDVVELVAAIADDARFEAQARGRDVSFAGAGELFAEVRAELLHRAFENVIRNAVKHTGEGSTVEVAVLPGPARDSLVATVSDCGPGVPEKDLEAIFEPFYRSENGNAATGFGLGLAIARRAVEAHGGSIRAANREGGGLRVEIRLPLGEYVDP